MKWPFLCNLPRSPSSEDRVYGGQEKQVTDATCGRVWMKSRVRTKNKLRLQAEGVRLRGKEFCFECAPSCARGQDEVSDCVAPRLGSVCHAAPLMGIYCFLNPVNRRLRTTEFQGQVFSPLAYPNSLWVLNAP